MCMQRKSKRGVVVRYACVNGLRDVDVGCVRTSVLYPPSSVARHVLGLESVTMHDVQRDCVVITTEGYEASRAERRHKMERAGGRVGSAAYCQWLCPLHAYDAVVGLDERR